MPPKYKIQGLTTFGASYLETKSGLGFDMLAPNGAAVKIEDVAHSLALQCRFNGHCGKFYSVAEHSVLVSDLLVAWGCDGLALAGLLHDAAEAYMGDLVSPVKFRLRQLESFEGFKQAWEEFEQEVDEAIHDALGLSVFGFGNPLVKKADQWALKIEAKTLLPSRGIAWTYDADVADLPADPSEVGVEWFGGQSPAQAKASFLSRYEELVNA